MGYLRVVALQSQRNGREGFSRFTQQNIQHIDPFLLLIRYDDRFLNGNDISFPFLIRFCAGCMPALAEFHIRQVSAAKLHETGFQKGTQKVQRPHHRAKQHHHSVHDILQPVALRRFDQQKPYQISQNYP